MSPPHPRALERKLLPHPGHEFRPRNPRGVVRAELLMRVAAAFRGVTVAAMPAGHRLLALSDVPDRQRRDGPPELVVGCKHPVIPVPVLARQRHEIGEPVEVTSGGRAIPGPCRRGRSQPKPRFGWTAAPASCRQKARGRRRHWPPAAWTCGCDWVRPSWRLCAGGARSGLWLRGRLRHVSQRVARARRGAGRNSATGVRDSENSSARRGR